MKHIHTRFILCAMFAFVPFSMGAQTATENETDSQDNAKDPLVQVAYRKVSQGDLLGGVSVVNIEELTDKNYTTYSLDNMQGYVGGWTGNSMWGMGDYLVLVDGVPRDANNVIPTEIEQISFLKGASAVVLYGSRAANGVVYITTKRGKVEDLRINVRANTGFHVAKSYPEYLGSAEYMTLYNEARGNDGLSALYSETDIYNHASGLNPYRYPSVDFYSSDYIKKVYNRSDITTEFSGGNERAKFYTNMGYYRVGDAIDFGEAKDNYVDRLNIRGNVDVKINESIKAYVNANATYYNARSANSSGDDYWQSAAKMRPNRVAPLIPISFIDPNDKASLTMLENSRNVIGGKYFLSGTQVDQTNIFADYYAGGYSKWTSRQLQFDTGIDIDLGKALKGLSFSTQFGMDYSNSYSTSYNNKYAVYTPKWANYNGSDVIVDLVKHGNDEKDGSQNVGGSTTKRTTFFSGQFNYETSINKDHNISAMLVAAGYQQAFSGVYHKTSNVNLGLQLGYNYMGKYFAEFGGAVIHSAKLPSGNRNAFSPSVTLGWKLDKENFLAGSSVVDELVLSASASVLHTDLDIADYYLYSENYTQADGAWWGWFDGASEQSTNSVRGGNSQMDYIKRKEFSVNLRTSLWNRLITADASYFINTKKGMLIQPTNSYPSYFFTYYPDASFIPYVNFNNDRRTGVDFNVNLNKTVGQTDLSLGVSGTYYKSKATKRDESYADSYQNRTGRPIDGLWGLVSDGFFTDETDVASSPTQAFGETKPGDIKYVDQNGDGIIDSKDEVYLGRGGWSGAPFTLGINLTAKWKDFTFFALCTGSYGAKAFKNNSYWWVSGDSKYSKVVRDRWTEDTKDTATYPRLTTQSSDNNFRNSDFWLYNTNRFDLAKVQVTYDLPKRVLRNTFLQEFSAYVSGANLLTIAKEREILEMNVGSAPQTRFYNVGVKVIF